jgi:hypothetical protein
MKKRLRLLVFILLGFAALPSVMAQCTPADSTSCPDPEGNGAVCPDTLQTAYLGQDYEQVVTMLIPSTYDTGIYSVPLHHVQLKDVAGLPEGIQWQSNADNNIFMAGNYYCVLFSGTPVDTGHYVLKIVVDVYSSYNNVPIFVGTTVDSTSIWIDVVDANAVNQESLNSLRFRAWPNPFRSRLQVDFVSNKPGKVAVDLYNLLGQALYHGEFFTISGENTLQVPTQNISPQTMIVRLKQGDKAYTKIISKAP